MKLQVVIQISRIRMVGIFSWSYTRLIIGHGTNLSNT